jgi:hypothetical protein
MAKFLKGFELNKEVETLLRGAAYNLWIFSPYIKLHHRYKDVLKNHLGNDKLEIILVFGKNDGELQKSLPKEELDFFIQFPNIEIRYEKRLHAKFYANDSFSIITSMNLYDYSQDNNIEAGILMETPLLNYITRTQTLETQAIDYFEEVKTNSELIFKKEPQYSAGILGIGKKYEKSIVVENKIDNVVKIKKEVKPKQIQSNGFCIKCGTEIPLKPTIPYCRNCYNDWKKVNDKTHQEKYCHICGEQSRASLAYPACTNCYRKEKRNLEFPVNKQ